MRQKYIYITLKHSNQLIEASFQDSAPKNMKLFRIYFRNNPLYHKLFDTIKLKEIKMTDSEG